MKSLRQTAATRPGDSRTRVPVEEVAARGRVSVATIRYRVAHREMSGLDRAGLFDLTRALRELARKPRQRGGRKAGPITPSPVPVRPGRDAATSVAARLRAVAIEMDPNLVPGAASRAAALVREGREGRDVYSGQGRASARSPWKMALPMLAASSNSFAAAFTFSTLQL